MTQTEENAWTKCKVNTQVFSDMEFWKVWFIIVNRFIWKVHVNKQFDLLKWLNSLYYIGLLYNVNVLLHLVYIYMFKFDAVTQIVMKKIARLVGRDYLH